MKTTSHTYAASDLNHGVLGSLEETGKVGNHASRERGFLQSTDERMCQAGKRELALSSFDQGC